MQAGDRMSYEGIELAAVPYADDGNDRRTCRKCHFRNDGPYAGACAFVKCLGVVWVNPLRYRVWRLTGELPCSPETK